MKDWTASEAYKQKRRFRKRIFSTVSAFLAFFTGLSALITSYSFFYAAYPVHEANAVQGILFMTYGALIVLGGFLVLLKRYTLLGALLVLASGFIGGPQSMAIVTRHAFGEFVVPLMLGWILSIVSCILALLSREPAPTKKAEGPLKPKA